MFLLVIIVSLLVLYVQGIFLLSFCIFSYSIITTQRRIQNTVKHLRWSFIRFIAPFQMFGRVLNTSLQDILVCNLCRNELISEIYRSNFSQMFFKIGVLKTFVNFTEKQLC